MGLVRTIDPAETPVELDDAKTHLRVDGTDEDDLITAYIEAATEYCETALAQQLVTATFEWSLDSFPDVLRVPRPPLIAVASIQYVDTAGDTQTLAASVYEVDAASKPGRVAPAYGEVWPTTREELGAVLVTFTAGYGDPEDVPQNIRLAILELVAWWHAQRMPVVVGTNVAEVPMGVEALLSVSKHGEYV